MKKHLSVFMLAVRGALWPTVIVSLLGAAASVAVMCFADKAGGFDNSVYDAAAVPVIAGVVVLSILLMRPLRGQGGVQPLYTLQRLRVSELTVFCWQAAVNALALFILQMFQAAACLLYGLYLQNSGLGAAGNMSVLVNLINSSVAHALLPLGDLPVYVRMALVYLALGAAAAYSSFMGRRGKTAVSPFVALAAAIVFGCLFAGVGAYSTEALLGGGAALVALGFTLSVRSRAGDVEESEDEPSAGGGDVAV